MAIIRIEELTALTTSEEALFVFGGKRHSFASMATELGVSSLPIESQVQTVYAGIKINQIRVEINKTAKQKSLEAIQGVIAREAVIEIMADTRTSEDRYIRDARTELDAKHARASIDVSSLEIANTLIAYIDENLHVDAQIEQDDNGHYFVVMFQATQKEVNKVVGLRDRIGLGRKVVGGTKKTFDTAGKALEVTLRGSAPILKGILSATAATIKGAVVATTKTAAHAVNVSVETAKDVAKEVSTSEECLRAVDKTVNGYNSTRRVLGGTRNKNKGVSYE